MIVDRIYEYLKTEGREVDDRILEVAGEQFAHTVRRNLGKQRAPGERRKISASLPWVCPRKAYYSLTGASGEVVSGRSRIAFLMGDLLETAVIVLAKQSGLVFPWPDEAGTQLALSLDVEVAPGVIETVGGHTDIAVQTHADGLIVGDVKSMSDYGFREFGAAIRDPGAPWWTAEKWGYLAQLRFYMWLLEKNGLGTGERGFFVAVSKNTGHLAELWVERCEHTISMFERAIPYLVGIRERFDLARDSVRETAIANGATIEEAEAAASIVPRNEAHGLPPRPEWTKIIRKPGQNLRPDGTKGPVLEVCTDADQTQGNGWRCSYCPHVARSCYPGFEVVTMKKGGKPVFRKKTT